MTKMMMLVKVHISYPIMCSWKERLAIEGGARRVGGVRQTGRKRTGGQRESRWAE